MAEQSNLLREVRNLSAKAKRRATPFLSRGISTTALDNLITRSDLLHEEYQGGTFGVYSNMTEQQLAGLKKAYEQFLKSDTFTETIEKGKEELEELGIEDVNRKDIIDYLNEKKDAEEKIHDESIYETINQMTLNNIIKAHDKRHSTAEQTKIDLVKEIQRIKKSGRKLSLREVLDNLGLSIKDIM